MHCCISKSSFTATAGRSITHLNFPMKINLNTQESFESRHQGKSENDLQAMLKTIGADSLETLINQTVPEQIRLQTPLNLPKAKSEAEFLADFKVLAQKNKIFKSYIGTGYYDTT